ncbi:HNH endonuclease signature motif containing protein [Cryobacterium sp. PH31-O1]|uniref:HNH endonuclease signature motif containing protein n=1 Tax=Cryobacterium sp. PH31-O1 TaxID=3046306 RepID=UPI0024BA7A60|nr:HNH endonuclease signature motif containing protein [Cryobacterium sp. PH31-O1]MDJ0337423.1 HNH endonuclease signature motif containing protein [Cryobacterium sp. PH31-O1]
MPPEDRFWSKVNKTGDCWLWTASKDWHGYGSFAIDRTMCRAHRVAYIWANGPIPDGLTLDHMCGNRACVNPDHLRAITNTQNHQNRQGADIDNASGVRGVSWSVASKKWQAKAELNGKQHFLGLFTEIAAAEAVVSEWRRINMPYSLMDQRPAGRE